MASTAKDRFENNSLYSEIDYNKIEHCNVYYKRILNSGGIPLPNFCKEITKERRDELDDNPKIAPENARERDFLRLMSFVRFSRKAPQHKLAQYARILLRQYPGDITLRITIAQTYMQRGFYSAAAQLLQTACELDPEDVNSLAKLGLMASLAGDHGRALSCARVALSKGEHLSHTMPKAFLFGNLLIGRGALVQPFDSRGLLDTYPETYDSALNGEANPLADIFEFVDEPETLPDQPVVFFSCDSGYFERFGQNLLMSMSGCHEKVTLHVHLINGSVENFDWLKEFSDQNAVTLIVSHELHEQGSLAKQVSYLASNRFILAPYFQDRFKRDYLILDADSVLNSEDRLFEFFERVCDPALYYIEFGPVWDMISAPFVYLPYGHLVTEKLSLSCRHYLLSVFGDTNRRGFWYVDQLALFGGYLRFSDSIQLIAGAVLSDTECSDDAIFWTLSNDKEVPKYVKRCNSIRKAHAK
ncbi:tetratricopeptide repeat protein [Kordiimonas sp.]|uniref:tetratricopeptide repeat protein n=1 Tax=Kordiimonas sp. TaxID=1970157 RepID=UPI003A8E87C3